MIVPAIVSWVCVSAWIIAVICAGPALKRQVASPRQLARWLKFHGAIK